MQRFRLRPANGKANLAKEKAGKELRRFSLLQQQYKRIGLQYLRESQTARESENSMQAFTIIGY